MKKIICLLCIFITLIAGFSALAAEIKTTPNSIEISFENKDQPYAILYYKSAHESGSIFLKSKDGMFTAAIPLLRTYPGNIVTLEAKTPHGKEILKKQQVKTALLTIEPVKRAETGRLKNCTVCIDPGHCGVSFATVEKLGPGLNGSKQTHNGQAQGVTTRRLENTVVMEIALKLRNALLKEGANVVMTRTTPEEALSNRARAEIGNEANADITLRLHLNLVQNPNSYGFVVYIPKDSSYAKAVADRETYKSYANAFLEEMKKATGVNKGSVASNNDFTGNNWAKMPCFLVEMGYISNPLEDYLTSDPAYQDTLVKGMVEGVAEFCKLRGIELTDTKKAN